MQFGLIKYNVRTQSNKVNWLAKDDADEPPAGLSRNAERNVHSETGSNTPTPRPPIRMPGWIANPKASRRGFDMWGICSLKVAMA